MKTDPHRDNSGDDRSLISPKEKLSLKFYACRNAEKFSSFASELNGELSTFLKT